MFAGRSYGIKKQEAEILDIVDCPTDSISDIAFNLENTHMAVSSWDCSVRIYRIPNGFNTPPSFTLEKNILLSKPVLTVAFFNVNIVAGLVDGSIIVIDPMNNQTPIQAHSAIVKSIKNYSNKFLISGSFDSSIKFWNLESTNPIHAINLPSKVYSMDVKGHYLYVGLGDKTVQFYDLNNISNCGNIPTKFMYPIRSIGCSQDNEFFAVGGVEAKVEVMSRMRPTARVIFKCHRQASKLYAVNVLRFYPRDPNILVSGGSDGSIVWFDKGNRLKLLTSEFSQSITAGDFSNDSAYFVFATGDDWSKGYSGNSVETKLKFIVVSSVPSLNK
jgi:mRNA export factor